jgi:hypothetical protein
LFFQDSLIKQLKAEASSFISSCRIDKAKYGFTPNSLESTPFTLCFTVFLSHLIGNLNDLKQEFPLIKKQLINGIYNYKKQRSTYNSLQKDKYFLQLLTFTLSSLYIIDKLDSSPLEDIVKPLIPKNIDTYLNQIQSYDGKPQSGNIAMCMAILLIYSRDYLNIDTTNKINEWNKGHINKMNKYGFWGNENLTHLQFQNGYHQYEIFKYLGIQNPKINNAIAYINNIVDYRGQFAPYFGGSGCYDYDAVSIITSPKAIIDDKYIKVLKRTSETILMEQNKDGGFSDSQWVRPRTLQSLIKGALHIFSGEKYLKIERLRYFVALQFPKHSHHHTHWTEYACEWGESNLWDTWFRLLTIARIDTLSDKTNKNNWGFINFPGIGYY